MKSRDLCPLMICGRSSNLTDFSVGGNYKTPSIFKGQRKKRKGKYPLCYWWKSVPCRPVFKKGNLWDLVVQEDFGSDAGEREIDSEFCRWRTGGAAVRPAGLSSVLWWTNFFFFFILAHIIGYLFLIVTPDCSSIIFKWLKRVLPSKAKRKKKGKFKKVLYL